MTKVVNLPTQTFRDTYEQVMEYLDEKYHSYPSNLPNLPISPEETSRMSYYEQQANDIAASVSPNGSVPLGKMVV